MPGWTNYKGLEVPADTPSGDAGLALKDNFIALADRAPQSNFSATVNPTGEDDDTDGYEIGSVWVNTTSKQVFVCVDNTTDEAEWAVIGPTAFTPVGTSSAFQGSDCDVGDGSYIGTFAQGHECEALGMYGIFAQGSQATTDGYYSNLASGLFTQGNNVAANSKAGGFAQGIDCEATGTTGIFTQGWSSSASGITGVFAQGNYAIADGDSGSFAQGEGVVASGMATFAQGIGAFAGYGYGSFAQGKDVATSGIDGAFVQGFYSTASWGQGVFVQGRYSNGHGYYGVFVQGGHSAAYGSFGSFSQGKNAVVSGDFGLIAQGYNATASGSYGLFAQGIYASASADTAWAVGKQVSANKQGQFARSTQNRTAQGDSQVSWMLARREISGGTTSELTTSGDSPSSTTRLSIASGRTWSFHIVVVARQFGGTAGSVGDSAGFELKGVISNKSGTTTLIGSTPSPFSLGADSNASTWTATVAADNTNDCLLINVTGQADKNIHWLADIRMAEVG